MRFAMRFVARFFVLFAICGAGLATGPRPASAELMYNFPVGTWSGGAFTKQNAKQFNHCAASANYNSGVLMSFSVSRIFAWSMAFAHPSWRLTQGQTYDIAFTVDQMPPLRARAFAVGANLVEVPLADSTELFQRFRQGYQLGSAGIVGFQIAEGDNGFVDAAWQANRTFGLV